MGKKGRRADGYGAYYWWVTGKGVQFSRLLKSLYEVLLLRHTINPAHHDILFQFVDLFNNLWVIKCFKILDEYFLYSKVLINTYRLRCRSCHFIITCFLYWVVFYYREFISLLNLQHLKMNPYHVSFSFHNLRKIFEKIIEKSFKITKKSCLRQLSAAY